MKPTLLFLAFALTVPAFALEDTPANRERMADLYLATTPPRDLVADMATEIAKGIPPEQRTSFTTTMTKNLDLDALTAGMRKSMITHFTADELKALADFYGSAIGRSAMKKFGVYMADAMPLIQVEVGKAIEKTQAELAAPPPRP